MKTRNPRACAWGFLLLGRLPIEVYIRNLIRRLFSQSFLASHNLMKPLRAFANRVVSAEST